MDDRGDVVGQFPDALCEKSGFRQPVGAWSDSSGSRRWRSWGNLPRHGIFYAPWAIGTPRASVRLVQLKVQVHMKVWIQDFRTSRLMIFGSNSAAVWWTRAAEVGDTTCTR